MAAKKRAVKARGTRAPRATPGSSQRRKTARVPAAAGYSRARAGELTGAQMSELTRCLDLIGYKIAVYEDVIHAPGRTPGP